jgi:hypothetical protein
MTPVPDTITFPSLVPSSRSFIDGKHPMSTAQTMAGLTVRRLLAAKATEPELRLKFSNISDAAAESILAAYDSAYGSRKPVTLPSSITAGIGTSMAALIRNEGSSLAWFFLGRPSLESIVPGLSSVTISFQGRIVPTFTAPELSYGSTSPGTGAGLVNGYACYVVAGYSPYRRYWRIANVINPTGEPWLMLQELGFYFDNTKRAPIAGSTNKPVYYQPLQNLWDNNLYSFAMFSKADNAANDLWISNDLGYPQQINGIKLGGYSAASYPQGFVLQHSVDNVNWITLGAAVNLQYPGDNTLSPLIRIG